ncbi:sensor domain-containing diguanylate cyclase [bacterium]|nr:sensor domain-containing diguanylate cyclase [candidate division CSSED10-310 bacterium]
MQPINVVVIESEVKNNGKPLSGLLQDPDINIFESTGPIGQTEAIVIPFQGRNRVDPKVKSHLKRFGYDIPVIGIETEMREIRQWEVTALDLRLSVDLPECIVCHMIKQTVLNRRREIELIRLRTDYQERSREIELLVKLGIQFTATLSRYELFNLIISRSVDIVPAEFHLLMILSENKNIASLVSYFGVDDNRPFLPTKRLTPEMRETLAHMQRPVHDVKPFQQSSFIKSEVQNLDRDVASMLIAPLLSKSKLLGYMIIGNRIGRTAFSDKDADQLEMLTDFGAVALENAMLYEKTELLAQIDDLTQVQNFTFTQNFLEKLTAEQAPFSILFLDLDGFKKVNQKYGHRKGNEALQRVSTILRNHTSPIGVTCRFGGDEFMLILPGSNLQSAVRLSEEILILLKAERSLPGIELSGSIGIAVFPEDGETIQAIVQAADMAMYQAKSLGPGHVTCYRFLNRSNGEMK